MPQSSSPQDRAKLEAAVAAFVTFLPKLTKFKDKMADKKLRVATVNCPLCKGKDTLVLRAHPIKRGYRGIHIHAACKADGCDFSFME